MPLFSYRIAKPDGTIQERQAEAEDAVALRGRLEEEGNLVLSISESIGFSLPNFSLKRKISPHEFLIFNQEFVALLRAGLPIMKILDLLSERGDQPGFAAALKEVQREVRGGGTIADAMSRHPVYFPPLYVSSLRAGEKSGNLVEVLGRFMEYQKKVLEVRKKVLAALAYPAFLLVVGIGVLGFLLTYVMPSFSELYADSQVELPLITRFLLGLVDFLRQYFLAILLGSVLTGLLLWRLLRSAWGRAVSDRLALQAIFLGPIIKRHHLIRIARTLSTVLKSGIPLVESLTIVGAAMTNQLVARQIGKVGSEVRGGVALALAFSKVALFPRMSTEMIAVGETTGSLEEMLQEVANFHEDELDLYLSRVATWVEPILLLLIGSLVAVILIAMYLPIFNLAGTIR